MKTVHKYRLEHDNIQHQLKLREGYRVVHSAYLVTEKAVFVWIEVPLDLSLPEQNIALRVFRTGEAIPKSFDYLASAIDDFGPEAYHIYRAQEALVSVAA